MKKVTVNGINYLGCLSEKAGKTTLKKAMEVTNLDDVTEGVFGKYLKAQNAITLRTIDLTGMGMLASVENLSPEENLRFDICKMKMKQAKLGALAGVENKAFDALLGK